MSDREEREEHIKRLEAALACEEKRSSGKCSKQTCDDNCALLYEQGNWEEWKETLRYAINSLKIDLKYDLLYEEISGQADKPTTKDYLGVDYLGVDCISRTQAQTEIEMNASRYTIAKERGGMGQVEWSDHLIEVSNAVDIIRNLPSVTPQEPRCKDCKWWKDSDGEYRRGCGAESQCPINRREVFEGNGYCYMFEPQESEDKE